ncbi:MAG: rod shape-determining protein MreC [Treponema sp.]|jgi:rod shape-determining protein MreC|nr:rod shape-determining protein MreC [Treponema sp.]
MAVKRNRKQRRRLSPEVYVFVLLFLVSFSALLFSARSFIVDFKDVGLSMFSGARGGIHELSSLISQTVLSVRELAALRREYAELTDRITRYEQLERNAAEIDQENRRLREQLGFSRTISYRHIPAEIIGRDPDNLYKAFAINKGKHAGVTNNMAVIAFHNGTQGLVGKVIRAGQFESLVLPLYDVSCSVAARLAVSRYEGIVEGQGSPNGALVMRFIQKRARDEINHGDMIVSSSLGGVYPAGINIGRVTGINDRDYEISMDLVLEPVIDFSRLEYVFVIDIQKEEEGEGDG